MNRRRLVALALLIACLIGGAALVFLPIGWQLNRFVVWLYYFGKRIGVPDFVPLVAWDIGLNVLLFAVPALLVRLVWPRIPGWLVVLVGFLGSGGIELAQSAFLPRDADWVDLVANTGGALLGVLVSKWMLRRWPAWKPAGTRDGHQSG